MCTKNGFFPFYFVCGVN